MGVSRSKAPPRALSLAHRLHVLSRVHREQLLELDGAAPRAAPSRASRARSSSASIARMRSARSGCPKPVSCSSEDGWLKKSGRARPLRYRVAEPPPIPLRADVAVVGAGAAGLYAALVAAREGARVALVSRSPLAQTASYWAQGGIAAALAEGDSPELHVEDTLAAGRGAARESAVRVLCEESPGARARARAARACASTPTGTAPWRSASRAATRAAGSSTPAAPPPAGASRASCRRSPPPTSGSGARAAPPPRRCWTPTGAASGWLRARRARRRAARGRARDDPRHRRHGRPLGAHHQPARRRRRRAGPGRRPPAPRWPTSSSCSSTPPRSQPAARATAS